MLAVGFHDSWQRLETALVSICWAYPILRGLRDNGIQQFKFKYVLPVGASPVASILIDSSD
jgi:hypothetical protein